MVITFRAYNVEQIIRILQERLMVSLCYFFACNNKSCSLVLFNYEEKLIIVLVSSVTVLVSSVA